MLANQLFTSQNLDALTLTHTKTHTHTYVYIQSPSISFRQVKSTPQREYPTALEKRFNSEMRENSGKCTKHMKALMPLHESNRPAGSTESG